MTTGGYGFGVWVVPLPGTVDPCGHIPHLTVQCNMASAEEARALANRLRDAVGPAVDLVLAPAASPLHTNYFDNDQDDQLPAVGFWATCDRWAELRELCRGATGSFSTRAHLTTAYGKAASPKDLAKPRALRCRIVAADIRGFVPCHWRLLL